MLIELSFNVTAKEKHNSHSCLETSRGFVNEFPAWAGMWTQAVYPR